MGNPISLYYLFYILSGGFRHFSFEYLFFTSTKNNISKDLFQVFEFGEYALFGLAFVLTIEPLQKSLNFLFFAGLLIFDFYFQNWIRFESSYILMHFFPLFIALCLQFNKLEKHKLRLKKAMLLFVSVGFVSSFTSKLISGWGNTQNMVLKNYFVEFYQGFSIPIFFGEFLIQIQNSLFWKSLDYVTLLFEGFFIVLFFTSSEKIVKWLFSIAVLFHVLVYVGLGIAQFYIYPLFYLFYFVVGKEYDFGNKFWKLIFVITSSLLLLFICSGFNIQFFNLLLSINQYVYIEFIYLLITSLLWFTFIYLDSIKKTKNSAL